MSLGARIVGLEPAKDIVEAWMNAGFESGRHQVRIDMIAELEETGRLRQAEEYPVPAAVECRRIFCPSSGYESKL